MELHEYKPGDVIRDYPAGTINAGTIKSSVSQGLAAGIASPPANETPELEFLLNRLFSTAEELSRAEARLATFADRLGGPVPECDRAACHPQGSSGFASRMEALHASLTTTMMDINSTISRLERLA